MAYNTKPIVTDVDGNPISQYYNPETDSYEPVEGQAGANKVVLYNADGTENNELSLIPILDKLSQLTGTVIDEETRKSNELQRIELYNQILNMLETGQLKGEKGDKGDTGIGLNFLWQGTSLGVKLETDTEYVFVDLRGPQGPAGNIDNLTSQHIETALGYTPVKSVNNVLADETGNVELDIDTSAIENRIGNVEDDLETHKAESVYEGEIHGLRIADGKLEYFDGENWKQIAGGSGSQVPLGNVVDFTAEPDDGKVILRWKDPDDIVVDGIIISKWAGTKILRKIGSYPTNENDGVLVVDSGVRNQYAVEGFVDTGLENNIEYFYMAFPYTTDGLYTLDIANRVSAIPTAPKIYGVEIDENNSNPETAVVYTDDAVGFIPARGNNGNFSWGSWENIIKDEFKIRPCVLRNLGGGNAEVNYYLDYDDYTKKADGTTATLTGADGDVMIEFGQELWWKFTRIGSKLKIQLSTKPFDGAIKPAFEIEDGYNLVPFYPLTLTQIIYVLMFKDLDSQTALGKGRTDADSYTNTGTTNKKTFCYGSTDATDNVKFLGMEDYFGNRRWWIDGCYYDNNRNMLIGKGNFNDTGSGYENFGQAAPSDLGGYIDKVQGGNNTGLIPASTGGSATTYYCDYGYVYTGRLPHFGGTQSNASSSGAFDLRSHTASDSFAHIGGRLFYSQNGKIYIGAYLGVEQNGRLRSISGYESANNKTIGAFRNLARANN